jgi:hypothetical protein
MMLGFLLVHFWALVRAAPTRTAVAIELINTILIVSGEDPRVSIPDLLFSDFGQMVCSHFLIHAGHLYIARPPAPSSTLSRPPRSPASVPRVPQHLVPYDVRTSQRIVVIGLT